MKAVHYISIIAALAITVLMLVGGKTIPPKNPDAITTPNMPSQPGMEMPVAANFDSILSVAKKKLSPQAIAMLNDAEAKTKNNDSVASQAFESMGKIWQQNRYPAIAAHYFAESGKLDNSEKKLNFAAHLYSESLKEEKNPNVKQWIAQSAIDCLNKSLAINPDNDTVRMDLGLAYIDGTGETMKGVQELLNIVKKDPANIPANLLLGGMAIESGQYDKAIERGDLILQYHKDNWRARIFMAEAYKSKGNKQKAVELLNEAKLYNKDPQFAKEIEAYIKSFN